MDTWTLTRQSDGVAFSSSTEPAYSATANAWQLADAQGEAYRVAATEQGFSITAPPPAVPLTVTKRQAKLALVQTSAAGGGTLYDTISSFIASQPIAVQINWNDATEFDRDNELLNALAAALGISSGQMDDLFRLAATIV